MDINELTLEELVELKEYISEAILNIKDGYFYIGLLAKHSSYKKEHYNNKYHAQQADDDSNYGEDYLIKIYSNNPNAGFIFVETKEQIPEKY